tara:strand:+ start:271 stop:747 length:477 start_codon:yes stop_codon:yes gene_type:complete
MSYQGKKDILTKGRIQWAIRQVKSARQAAKLLGCNRKTFKKYAERYGLYEQIKNQSGEGIPKAYNLHSGRHALDDIIEGKYPKYDVSNLQKRLIGASYVEEKCASCGFEERRITDYRVPLKIDFLDGDTTNHKLDNIQMLCYNCYFLQVGNLNGRNKE